MPREISPTQLNFTWDIIVTFYFTFSDAIVIAIKYRQNGTNTYEHLISENKSDPAFAESFIFS